MKRAIWALVLLSAGCGGTVVQSEDGDGAWMYRETGPERLADRTPVNVVQPGKQFSTIKVLDGPSRGQEGRIRNDHLLPSPRTTGGLPR